MPNSVQLRGRMCAAVTKVYRTHVSCESGGERRRCFWATAVQSEAVRMWRMDVRSSLTPESVTVKAVGYHHHTAQFPLEIKTPLEGPRVHSGRFSHKQNQRHVFKSISMLSTANACVRVTGEGYNRYFTASSVTGLFFFCCFCFR